MPASLNDIYRALGELTATIKAVNDKVDRISGEMTASEANANASRANVHRRLDEAATRTANLETDMAGVKTDMAGVKKVVTDIQAVTDDVVAMRQKAAGAGTLGHWLIKIGIGVVAFAGWLVSLYTWITGRPPP
ncbi:DUF1515 domain-containing protein [Mesorhizobium sp. J428]|uniref:DUF1515 domain-containing protein n=1 Tax=Mesorhizobium sp. J428 TaxID=2898440 RepID=UPI0021519719|nr:DUF1515 domain-containing protein [Mesorhizobium sp. J428]MCR5859737.1 DUF1515 domain-containing protein [Mesorhizobium sp. J428]